MKSNLRRISHLLVLGLGMVSVSMAGMRQAEAVTTLDITKGCRYGAWYDIVWDGWKGDLRFDNQNSGYLLASGRYYQVRYSLHNAQDNVSGYVGPGYRGTNTTGTYRIVFWADFNNTPSNPNDDQRFDGYVMTQTKNAMAGVTWWNNWPFGFYAKFNVCEPG